MKTRKTDGMLVATFLTTLFYAATYPYIHKQIIMVASDGLIAINQIINCFSIVLFGTVWNKWSGRLFKYYPMICVAETLLGICSTVFAICTKNIAAYYMIDTLIFAVVTRNICCGGVKLRALRYKTEEERERFDNNDNSAYAVATIIGSLVSMSLDLSFDVMLCIATFGNAIDNIFYILIYRNTTKESA